MANGIFQDMLQNMYQGAGAQTPQQQQNTFSGIMGGALQRVAPFMGQTTRPNSMAQVLAGAAGGMTQGMNQSRQNNLQMQEVERQRQLYEMKMKKAKEQELIMDRLRNFQRMGGKDAAGNTVPMPMTDEMLTANAMRSIEPKTAGSPIGKINADFKAGNITKVERDAAIAKALAPSSGTQIIMPGNSDPNYWAESDINRWNAKADLLLPMQNLMPNMNTLIDTLLTTDVETGKWQEATMPFKQVFGDMLGKEVPGLAQQESLLAQISYITPRMRVSGSGSSSDADMKLFGRSVADLGNSKLGNYIGAWTMREGVRQSEKMLAAERQLMDENVGYGKRQEELAKIGSGIYAKPKTSADIDSLKEGTVYIHPDLGKLRVAGWNKVRGK